LRREKWERKCVLNTEGGGRKGGRGLIVIKKQRRGNWQGIKWCSLGDNSENRVTKFDSEKEGGVLGGLGFFFQRGGRKGGENGCPGDPVRVRK